MKEKGLTLIELSVVAMISGILGVSIFSVFLFQQISFFRQLDVGEAQQNGRAALQILRKSIQEAGLGMLTDSSALGVARVGSCFGSSSGLDAVYTCDGVDAGSDRIRTISMMNPIVYGRNADVPMLSPSGQVACVEETCPTLGTGFLGILSGKCGSVTLSELIRVQSINIQTSTGSMCSSLNSKFQCSVYGFNFVASPLCSFGYSPGYTFGPASVTDFFIDKTNPKQPNLMMRTYNPGGSTLSLVAQDIEDLQAQYGIDTTTPTDDVPDLWCEHVSSSGSFACASGFSEQETAQRIVAVRVIVVPKTRRYRASMKTEPTPSSASKAQLFNHQIVMNQDGYARFIFKTTIALRN